MTSTTNSIRPGQPWFDTNGKRIQAHGGSIIEVDGTFYWYGENKEHTTGDNLIWHWGVKVYSSTDLMNWTDRGLLIPPTPEDPGSPLHPESRMDRPHIIRDPRSGRYIAWLKIMDDGHQQSETVLAADSFLGPYEIVRTGLKPAGMSGGDLDLVVDPDEGKGYYYFDRAGKGEIICADLTENLTDVTGYYTTHLVRKGAAQREAPAYFHRHGNHYLLTSGRTGYFPNPTEAAVARSYHGPWEALGRTHVGDRDLTSFGSQISSVFKHPGKKDLYIALGDRWLPDEDKEFPHIRAALKTMIEFPETGEALVAERVGKAIASGELDPARARQPELHEFNTSASNYVWLPLRFDGDTPVIEWLDEWSVDDFE